MYRDERQVGPRYLRQPMNERDFACVVKYCLQQAKVADGQEAIRLSFLSLQLQRGKVCYQQKKESVPVQLSNNNIYSLLYFKLTNTHLSFWESCDVHQSSPICISTIRLSSSLAFSCSNFTVSHTLIFPDLSPIRRVSCLSLETRRAVMGQECTRSGKM